MGAGCPAHSLTGEALPIIKTTATAAIAPPISACAIFANYCGIPSMAKVRNFAYCPPIFRASANAADLR